jgi:hypothetical protein
VDLATELRDGTHQVRRERGATAGQAEKLSEVVAGPVDRDDGGAKERPTCHRRGAENEPADQGGDRQAARASVFDDRLVLFRRDVSTD